jgi:AcrR family transcriptional regulator
LKVAANLFSLKGYAGTTMAEIADSVGIRSPSLYYHFSDKASILLALADIILDEAISDSHKLLENKKDPINKRVHDLVSGLVYRLRTSPYELNCMFDPAFHGDEFRAVNKKLHAWTGDLESLIRQGVDTKVFAPQNPKVATHTVRGLVESAIRHPGGYPLMAPAKMSEYVAAFAVKGLS